MRGALAKTLRGRAFASAPRNLSATPTYQPVPGTGRVRYAMAPELQADGTIKVVNVQVPTCTFRLAPDCARYYTQKFKRAVLKFQREQR